MSSHPRWKLESGVRIFRCPRRSSRLFIRSIAHLFVAFGTRDTIIMSRGMRRCQRLVQKFPSLRKVTIDFEIVTCDAGFLVIGDPLKSDFGRFLNAINYQHSHRCELQPGGIFDRNYMLELFPLVIRLRSSGLPATTSFFPTPAQSIHAGANASKCFLRTPHTSHLRAAGALGPGFEAHTGSDGQGARSATCIQAQVIANHPRCTC